MVPRTSHPVRQQAALLDCLAVRVMASEAGGELYSKRQCMVEPVFAQIKTNRRIARFKRRGRAAVRSEWRLIAATHNLLKLHRHQLATATA
jgi:hypothetical protein